MTDEHDDASTTDDGPDRPDDQFSLDGNDRGWLWFLVFAVPVGAFFVSYALGAFDQLNRAADPPGIRIGIVSKLFGTDMVVATIFGGLTFLVLFYFAYRYSASRVAEPHSMTPKWGANTLRLMTIGVAFILLVTFMFAGATLANTDQMPANVAKQKYGVSDELHMTVVGSQWAWRDTVQGVNYTQTDTVRVPANTVIAVSITSTDVDHSWAVEQLGVKKDAIPGQVTHTWFVATQPGTYQANCAELCGKGHSKMTQKVVVMPKDKYVQWAHSHGYTVPFADNASASTNAAPQPANHAAVRPAGATAHV